MVLNYIALKIVVANLPMCHFKVARQTGLVLCRMIRTSLWTHKHLLPKLNVVFFKRPSDRKAAMLPSRAQSVQVIDIMCHTRTLLKPAWNSGFVKYCTKPDKSHPHLKFPFQYLFLFFGDVSVGIKCVPTLKIDVLLNLPFLHNCIQKWDFVFRDFRCKLT